MSVSVFVFVIAFRVAFMWSQSQCVFLSLPQWWWWWQWWDYVVGVCSLSTVSPHGLLPPLSFYSLLLGDSALSPNATQAKTPLSSFARVRYPGNTAISPLLSYTHLLSSLIPPPPIPLSSARAGHRFFSGSMSMRVMRESLRYTWNSSLGFQIWQV